MTIEIDIDEAYLPLVSPHRLSKAVQAVLDAESAVGDVTVFITDDDAVAELNQRFLGIDGATDVLSFPAQGEESNFVLPPDLGFASRAFLPRKNPKGHPLPGSGR